MLNAEKNYYEPEVKLILGGLTWNYLNDSDIETVIVLMKRVKTRSVKLPPTVGGIKPNINSTDGT